MRVLSYLVLLLMFSVASAQTPTILQGDYISNVFGNSNFILNPNAQTSNCTTSGTITCANVTVTNASITRVTTTPLVARTEFNVAITSANGTATWATRAFDQGMKGQNCEARFTYRGFAATSKVHIKQGANTVASLNLTPATDPRIASINFPCGDLSTATTFVVTDTAILAGTNEIGGIYTGLATNMANVAQAEFVGATELASCTTPHTVTSTTFANLSSPTCTRNNFGAATTSTNDFSVTIPNAKPGWYFVKWNGIPYADAGSNNSCYWALKEDTQGYIGGATYANSPTGFASAIGASQLTMDLNTTTTATRTFRVVGKSATGACKVDAGSIINSTVISVFRFPTSSELVVTPERQNTFAGLKGIANGFTNAVTAISWTKLTSSTTLTRTAYGKAKVETNNDYSITVENMPVGTYFVSVTNRFHAFAGGVGDRTVCNFGIADTATGGAQISAIQVDSYGDASAATQGMLGSTMTGIYVNSSVANRTFFVQAIRLAGIGDCRGYGDTNGGLTITVTPLDQPSNSALYVQGPVLAAATGAAIPAGYQHESKLCSGSRNFVNNTTGGTGWSLFQSVSAGCTLTPGIYLVRWTVELSQTSGTSTGQKTAVLTTDSSDSWGPTSNLSQGNISFGNATLGGVDSRSTMSIVTVTSSGITGGTGFTLYGKVLVTTHTAFTGDYNFQAVIVRLN